MMTTIFRRVLLIATLVPAAAVAQNFQSHAAIDTQVANALAGTGSNAMLVDRRLKLATCPDALRVDAPVMGAVAVHCAALGWRVRLPVDTASVTQGNAPVVIKRGDPVSVNFVAPGFSVTTSGIAESEARIGERVRVRVEQKANPVMGEAIDAGSVRVGNIN